MTQTGSPYAFISYASADRDRVLTVVEAIASAGIRVWLDQEGIDSGTSYGPAIASAIRNSRAVVVLCSDAALHSRNVRQEIAVAWKHEVPYLPLLLERITELPEEVEYWLEGAQWIEVFDHPTDAWLPQIVQAMVRLGVISPPMHSAARTSSQVVSARHVVPTPLTPVIGREQEIEDVARLLDAHRLVTILGPGGTGKTRLALAVAEHVRGRYANGIAFVDLSAIADPALVVPTIAATLNVREAPGQPLITTLSAALANQHLLLVIDNWEQVVDGARHVATLLTDCPTVHVLATSRVPLRLRGEHEYPLLPLNVPVSDDRVQLNQLRENDAVALFLERAAAVRPGFALTRDNAQAIAEMCRRLDGLPLAIELAATRVKVLPPSELLTRLEQPLAALTGGARDLPERHRTLRQTIQWSHDLLSEDEQRLFRRLGIFAGGWTLDAVEGVANLDQSLALEPEEGMIALVEQSFVVPGDTPDGAPRFRMLTTIRDYALERLVASGEADSLGASHAEYFLQLAEAAGLDREEGTAFIVGLNRLEGEFDNLRAALNLATEHDAERAYRLVIALYHLWYTRGHITEGRRYLHAVLDRWPTVDAALRARALNDAGTLASWQGDTDRAVTLHTEARHLYEEIGDQHGVVQALFGIGRAEHFGGNIGRGRTYYERSLQLARSLGDRRGIAFAAGNLAMLLAVNLGEHEAAMELNAEALQIERDLGSQLGVLIRTKDRAELALYRGEFAQARPLFAESLRLARDIGMMRYIADCIVRIGFLHETEGDLDGAGLLVGAGMKLRESMGYDLPIMHQSVVTHVEELRSALGAEQFDRLVAEGRSLSLEDAIALALGETSR